MKLKFEMHGYEITIEETEENMITVSASKDGEVIEEFELEGGEDHPGHEEMDELPEGEESMEEGEPIEGEEQEDFESEEKPMGESKLESFASFLKRK